MLSVRVTEWITNIQHFVITKLLKLSKRVTTGFSQPASGYKTISGFQLSCRNREIRTPDFLLPKRAAYLLRIFRKNYLTHSWDFTRLYFH